MDEKVRQYFDYLLNKQIGSIGRASNMLCLGIGEKINITNRSGEQSEVSKFSLHIQSAWRIVNREKREIMLASSDFYIPSDLSVLYQQFDWDVLGKNMFDKKSPIWLKNSTPLFIREYKLNIWGDLLLVFSNEDRLEVYVDASDDTECWRLFERGGDKCHLVMTGLGISFD